MFNNQHTNSYTCGKKFIPHTSLRPFDIDNVPAKFQLQTMLEHEYVIDAQVDAIREKLPGYRQDVVNKVRNGLYEALTDDNAEVVCRQLFRTTHDKETILRHPTDMLSIDTKNPAEVKKLLAMLRERVNLFPDISLFCAYKLAAYRTRIAIPYLVQELYDGLHITLVYQTVLNDVIHPQKLIDHFSPTDKKTPTTTTSTTTTTPQTMTPEQLKQYLIELPKHDIPYIEPPTFKFIGRCFYSDAPQNGLGLIKDCVQLIIELYRESQRTRIISLGKAYNLLRQAGWKVNTATSLYLKDVVMFDQVTPYLIQKYHTKFPQDLIVKCVHDCLRRTDFVYDEAVDLYDREIQRRNRVAKNLKELLQIRGQVVTVSDRALIMLSEACHWDNNIAAERFDITTMKEYDAASEKEYQERIAREASAAEKATATATTTTTSHSTEKNTNTTEKKDTVIIVEHDEWEGLDDSTGFQKIDYYHTFQKLSQIEKDHIFLEEVQKVLSSSLMVALTKEKLNCTYGVLLDWDTRNVPLTADHPYFRVAKAKDSSSSSAETTKDDTQPEKGTYHKKKFDPSDPTSELYALNTLFKPYDPKDYIEATNVVPNTIEQWSPSSSSSNTTAVKKIGKQSDDSDDDDTALSAIEGHTSKTKSSTSTSSSSSQDKQQKSATKIEKLVVLRKEFDLSKAVPYEANTEITKLFSLTGAKPLSKNHPINSRELYTPIASPVVETDVSVVWCRLDRGYNPSHQLFVEGGGKWYEQDYYSRFLAKNPKIGDFFITPGYASCSRFIIHVFVPDFFIDGKQVLDCINVALHALKNFSSLIAANCGVDPAAPGGPAPIVPKTVQFTSLHDTITGIPAFFSFHILLASIRRYLDTIANRRTLDKVIVTIDDERVYHVALRCACFYFPPPKYDSTTMAETFQNTTNKTKNGIYYKELLPYIYKSPHGQDEAHNKLPKTTTVARDGKTHEISTIPPREDTPLDATTQSYNTLQHQRYIRSITPYDDARDKHFVEHYNNLIWDQGRRVDYY